MIPYVIDGSIDEGLSDGLLSVFVIDKLID